MIPTRFVLKQHETLANLPFDAEDNSRGAIRPSFEETVRRTERVLGRETSAPSFASDEGCIDAVIGRAMDELDLLAASMLTKAAEDPLLPARAAR